MGWLHQLRHTSRERLLDCSAEAIHCTVSENAAACCNDPAVAITVTVDVVGEGFGVSAQPPITARLATLTASSNGLPKRCFVKPHSASAIVQPRNKGLRLSAAVVGDIVTVSFVETTLPDGVTDWGEKPQDAPAGTPAHRNETAELKPRNGVTETVSVELSPALSVIDGGATPTEKSAEGRPAVFGIFSTRSLYESAT